VDQTVSSLGSDWILFGIPLIALLAFTFFRLDSVFTSHKKNRSGNHASPSSPIRKGRPLGIDPDGRALDDPPPSKKK
jgi:hypothetical protein